MAKVTGIDRVALRMCVAVLALAAVPGCGSDDDSADDDPGQATIETAVDQSPAPTTEPTGADHPFCDLGADAVTGTETPSSDELQNLADSAPEEIKDDVQTIVDAVSDPANADAAALQEAAANVDEWGQENCE